MIMISSYIREQVNQYELHCKQYLVFGLLGIFHSVLPFFLWRFVFIQNVFFQFFSLGALLSCFLVLFHVELPVFLKKNIKIIWYCSLFYCFPLQSTLMFMNNIYNPEWALYLAAGFISLMFFTNSFVYICLSLCAFLISVCYSLVVNAAVIKGNYQRRVL